MAPNSGYLPREVPDSRQAVEPLVLVPSVDHYDRHYQPLGLGGLASIRVTLPVAGSLNPKGYDPSRIQRSPQLVQDRGGTGRSVPEGSSTALHKRELEGTDEGRLRCQVQDNRQKIPSLIFSFRQLWLVLQHIKNVWDLKAVTCPHTPN